MSSQTELRIIVTPTHVDRVQLLAADDDGEIAGLELYQKIIGEIQHFTKRVNQILQGVACVPTRDRGLESLSFTDPRGNHFYFSYGDLIAFWTKAEGMACREKVSRSNVDAADQTKRHLDRIQPDHSKRISKAEFDRLYDEIFTD